MVEAIINARNPQDNSLRNWGLGIDKIPRGNWLKDDDIIKSSRHEGDGWKFNFDVSDGKHVLYFIVSQTDPTSGGYDGEALIDGAGFNFKGVDNDTIAEFPIVVKNGKAKRDGPSSQAEATDIPENTGMSKVDKFKGFVGKAKSLKNIKDWDRTQALIAAGISVTLLAGLTAGVLLYTRKKGRF